MGWEDAVRLLSSSEVRVRVRIKEGMGGFGEEGGRGTAGWLPHRGNVGLVAGIRCVGFGDSDAGESDLGRCEACY